MWLLEHAVCWAIVCLREDFCRSNNAVSSTSFVHWTVACALFFCCLFMNQGMIYICGGLVSKICVHCVVMGYDLSGDQSVGCSWDSIGWHCDWVWVVLEWYYLVFKFCKAVYSCCCVWLASILWQWYITVFICKPWSLVMISMLYNWWVRAIIASSQ